MKPVEALRKVEAARIIYQKLTDANSRVTDFQSGLARCLNLIGLLLSETGKPVEALAACQQSLNIKKQLVDANPKVPEYQSALARGYFSLGSTLAKSGQVAKGLATNERGIVICRRGVTNNPTMSDFQSALSYGVRNRTSILNMLARTDNENGLRQAVELLAKGSAPDTETRFELARALALLAGLGMEVNSGVSAAEAGAFADQAVAALADAVKGGWARRDELKEPEFDLLRTREDFQKLVKELEARALKMLEVAPLPRAK